MDEAILCDRVALLLRSEILAVDSPAGIISRFGHKLWSVRSDNMYRLLEDIRPLKTIRTVYLFGQQLHVTLTGPAYGIDQMEAYLAGKGHREVAIREIPAGIEDCFMELMSDNS
jgi:ABC-type multidrug transport system ATPase subunit